MGNTAPEGEHSEPDDERCSEGQEQVLEMEYSSFSKVNLMKELHENGNSCIVLHNVFSQAQVEKFTGLISKMNLFDPVKGWLGRFSYCDFRIFAGKNRSGGNPLNLSACPMKPYNPILTNSDFVSFIGTLAELAPKIPFSFGEVHRYSEGQYMDPHSDPSTHRGAVVIAIFGTFSGGNLIVEGNTMNIGSGDVILLRGFDSGYHQPMPLHQVTKVISGTRYSVVLTCTN